MRLKLNCKFMEYPKILIIDLGSQYTLVIGRTLRELGYRSVILSPKKAESWLKNHIPKGIILSGGSSSVYEENAPSPPREILELGVPILGICYGMQWLANNLGGKVVANRDNKEYGETLIQVIAGDSLFSGMKGNILAWASHGDSVKIIPSGFKVIAKSGKMTNAAMSSQRLKIWGIQFHPEVNETENGKIILNNFVENICACFRDWQPQDMINKIREYIKKNCLGKAIIGFSGGVDSTTLASIIAPVLGADLQAICIDTGALREGEIWEIQKTANSAGVILKIIEAKDKFQEALKDVKDAEEKRARFKEVYSSIFEKEADKFNAEYFIQGSLATDFIESGSAGKADLIKSHHNIGLNTKLKSFHPLRELFKYEIRELARILNLPSSVSERQPFPGPGLFIRVIGAPPTLERLKIVKWADDKITAILKNEKIYNEISQLIVALICCPTVGVKGDGRVYAGSIIVRAVLTTDFMTAKAYQFPAEVRRAITSAITKHPEIVRVWFEETDKPPATTEFE